MKKLINKIKAIWNIDKHIADQCVTNMILRTKATENGAKYKGLKSSSIYSIHTNKRIYNNARFIKSFADIYTDTYHLIPGIMIYHFVNDDVGELFIKEDDIFEIKAL